MQSPLLLSLLLQHPRPWPCPKPYLRESSLSKAHRVFYASTSFENSFQTLQGGHGFSLIGSSEFVCHQFPFRDWDSKRLKNHDFIPVRFLFLMGSHWGQWSSDRAFMVDFGLKSFIHAKEDKNKPKMILIKRNKVLISAQNLNPNIWSWCKNGTRWGPFWTIPAIGTVCVFW